MSFRPLPSPSQHTARVRSYYRNWAPLYDATRWMFLFDRALAVRRLGLRPGEWVLEIGAGTGRNLPLLAQAVGPSGRIVLLDFSPEMLRRAASRKARFPSHRIDLICADATGFRLRRRFDAVFFSYSLALIPGRAAALEAGLSHLAPGGRLGVLEFGRADWLGPIGRSFTRWLAVNNVTPCLDEVVAFGTERLAAFEVDFRRRGYNGIAVGRKPQAER
jgi:S-adenosylmethionine-diacylgycerolhomoserine-N-methlytransferase